MKRIVVLMIIGILILPIFYFPGEIVLADPANVYYVANDGNDGNSGTSQGSPWRTIGKVNSEFGNAISAGDDIYFKRGDTFNDVQLTIGVNGLSESDNTIIGAYGEGDRPYFNDPPNYNCIHINNRDYITIENIKLTNYGNEDRWIVVAYSSYITIQNCIAYGCNEGAAIKVGHTIGGNECDHIYIRNNTFENAGVKPDVSGVDVISISDTEYLLFENNTVIGGPLNDHACMVVRTRSYYIIIRNNTFSDGDDDLVDILADTRYILTENNIFDGSTTRGNAYKMHGGYGNIARNNIFYDVPGYGIGGHKNDAGGCIDTRDCTWYHNTIYNIGDGDSVYDGGFRYTTYSGTKKMYDNVIKNNIFHTVNKYGISIISSLSPFDTYFYDNVYDNNIIYGAVDHDVYYDGTEYTIAEAEAAELSDTFQNNIDIDPQFVDAANYDFTLSSSSPAIDAAAWLTLCDGGGTGTAITVENADYFYDGFGLIGGDEITVGTDDVTITDVNYATNVITVTPSITWVDDDPVSLRYNGDAPDIGAKEYSEEGPWTNTCPTSSSPSPSDAATDVSIDIGTWSVTISDADGNTTTGTIECSSGDFSSWSAQASGTRSCSLSTLSYSTEYTVWVNYTDELAICSESDTYTFTTESEDVATLTSPTNLVASNPTTTSISLEWNKGYMGGTLVHDILYVDNFTKYAGNPIFDKSDTGSWADYGIRENALLTNSTGHIVKVDGKYVIYFNGRQTTPRATRIGRADSSDGVSWDVANDYVFSDADANSYTFVGSVIQRGENDYIMYYGALNESSEGIIKYATSSDSITWTAQNEILNENEFTNAASLNIPYVIYFDNGWHMVMEGDVSPSQGFKIFYANSSDGENWTAIADAIYSGSSGEWDSEDAANPSLYKLDTGKYVIFYNGNSQGSGYIFDLGVLYSTSVTSGWTSWKNNPILTTGAGGEWDDTRLEGPRLYMDDMGNATLRMWYFGLPTSGSFINGAIGYAICNETITDTMIRYSTSDNLTTYTDGSLGYNGTDSYTTITGLNPDTKYYFRAWSWNETEGWNTTGSNTVNENTLNPVTAGYIWSDADGAGSGTMINFDASSSADDNGIALYEWDWNDDGTYDFSSASSTASHDYGDINLHDCALRVTDTYSQTDTFTDTVQADVDNPPTAGYIWSDADGAGSGTMINFDASSSADDNGIALYEWDWNDDGTYDFSSASSTASHDYGDINLHDCALRVTDTYSQTDTFTDTVQADVDNPPTAGYIWSDADGAGSGTMINFDASSSADDNGIALYEWDWNDDGTYDFSSASSTASHDYGDINLHDCALRVTDTYSQTDTFTDTVQADVDNPPTAGYIWSDADGAGSGTMINFDASSSADDNGIALYEWDWNDDGTYDFSSASSTASHDYGDINLHDCALRVTDTYSQTDTFTDTVQADVDNPPTAGYIWSDADGAGSGTMINFDASSSADDNGIALYEWDWNDDGTYDFSSASSTASHDYGDINLHDCALRVTDTYSQTDTFTDTVQADVDNPPTAGYIWSDADGAGSGTMINFDASSSADDNGIALYEWDWNDDGTYDFSSASSTASHDYGDINLHDCALRVTDTYSQTDTFTDTVQADVDNPPTAGYIWSDADGAGSGTMINFDASSSADDNGIALYEWDWNDDGTYDFSSASSTASHDYGDINLHDCALRVTDTYSQTDTFTDTVQADVDNPPTAGYIWSDADGAGSGTMINFDASSSADDNGIALYEWDWNDDGTYDFSSASSTASHDYGDINLHDCALRVTDTYSQTDTFTDTVQADVDNPPTAGYIWSDADGAGSGTMINFDASSSADDNGIALYEWDWNDDGTYDFSSASSTASHDYGDINLHDCALRVTDTYSQTDTFTDTVQADVDNPPEITNINLIESDPLDTNSSFGWINITCDVTDNIAVDEVSLSITNPDGSYNNVSMNAGAGDSYYYNSSTAFSTYGNYSYLIWANDTNGNPSTSTVYDFSMPPNWDIDMNGVCNVLDITLISNKYNEQGQNGWLREDVDNNGIIQVFDFVMVSMHYYETW